ncbi:MAG TPA: hypothetical protein VG826_32890 [Pirellulales bacterium]|nr:hypothetical protein [Pirellulales bacterium]
MQTGFSISEAKQPGQTLQASQMQPGVPADWVRTLVSFLIFLHLFALCVAVLSNWNPSDLALRLRRVPLIKPYIEYLGFDQSYVPLYGFTFGLEEDTDSTIEVVLKFKDGSESTWTLPDAGLWPRERRRHDARLVETAADVMPEDYRDYQSIVPQAIAAHFVARHPNVKSGVIRCVRQLQQPMESLASSNPAERDPYDKRWSRQLYEARILVVGGSVKLMKSEAAAEVAPAAVENSAAENSGK